jgi:hypothetical protein
MSGAELLEEAAEWLARLGCVAEPRSGGADRLVVGHS